MYYEHAANSCFPVFVAVNSDICLVLAYFVFFFQAEDGIRDLVRSRGLGDVYKRQLREGEQAANGGLNLEQKMEITRMLAEVGIQQVQGLSLIHI